jgi:phosphate transport system substrate-binding protein
MLRTTLKTTVVLAFIFVLTACRGSDPNPGQNQPSTTILNIGSDTMVNLALAWAEAYQSAHPNVNISVTGGGSGTGIASLINGTTDIANASRKIKESEIDDAIEQGITPNEIVVAKDAIAVIVHPSNPVDRLTIRQISDIYSGKINNWLEVGGEDRPIVRLSRETNSGTHVYFLEVVLRLGKKEDKTLFSTDTLLMPSSEGISVEVSQNPNAIGYDGLGYVTSHMKMIAVAKENEGPFVLPSSQTANDGTYPIARDLYMYTAGEPTGALKAYIDFLFSPEAQKIVNDLGFVPIR